MPLRSRTFLLRCALIALLAMLASVLLPPASTLAGMRGQFAYLLPGDICSAGMTMQLPDDDPVRSMGDCALCHLQAESPALPSAPAVLFALLAPARWNGASAAGLAPPFLAWLAAAPRGPPLPF